MRFVEQVRAEFGEVISSDQETIRLLQLLGRPEVRLVTITAPGDVGKTSLAWRLAHEAQDSFAEGVFFISLAPFSDPTLIVPIIAQALSLPELRWHSWR